MAQLLTAGCTADTLFYKLCWLHSGYSTTCDVCVSRLVTTAWAATPLGCVVQGWW